IPSAARAARLVETLTRIEGYWGPCGVRTLPHDDFFFQQAPRLMQFDFKKNGRGPVSNWSGPVWVLSNYYLAKGLAAYGFDSHARELAEKTWELLERDLASTGA